MKIGIFTVSMPEYEPAEAFRIAEELGYDGLQLRVTEDKGDRSKAGFWSGNRMSIAPQELVDRADEIKNLSLQHKLELPSLGTYVEQSNMELVETCFKAAQAVGAKHIRVGPGLYDAKESYLKQLEEAKSRFSEVAAMAKQYGVKALLETHMNHLTPNVFKCLQLLDPHSPENVGIMYDPSNMVHEGWEPPEMAVDMAGDYLAEVHLKNSKFIPNEGEGPLWAAASCQVPDGIVDWKSLLQTVKNSGYDDWLFFEDFSTETPLYERLKNNITWIRDLVSKLD